MAWASTSKVSLGCIAFVIWWLFAVFPEVRFLPIGRTAGSILGATLMVVFQVISPSAAFAAVDIPTLAFMFATMVTCVYLRRAGLFEYLGKALSWRTRGGIDFLCRLCLMAAVSSALFTNDTTCVVFTYYVLQLCREKNLRPGPFLIALASSSNIGSAATPIGNPQNLVIAVSSRIRFWPFLVGVLPTVALGLVVNTLLLLAVFGRSLSLPSNDSTLSEISADPVLRNSNIPSREASDGEVVLRVIPSAENCDESDHGESRQERGSKRHSSEPNSVWLIMSGSFPAIIPTPEFGGHTDDAVDESVERKNSDGGIICTLEDGAHAGNAGSGDQSMERQNHDVDITSTLEDGAHAGNAGSGDQSMERKNSDGGIISTLEDGAHAGNAGSGDQSMERQKNNEESHEPGVPSGRTGCTLCKYAAFRKFRGKCIRQYLQLSKLEKKFVCKCGQFKWLWKKYLWKPSVYLVTSCMHCAYLAGLSLPLTAITAAVAMMVMDLSDAGPSLDKVSYALLVFFSGMFIATSGFNATGAPEEFWTAVEPHSRIDSASGVSVLALVVTILSNVASNVPTVILLGPRLAASAANTGASPDKAWLILAWVSTVAGNLTLVGSAANLIVCEQARPTAAEKERREGHSNGLQGPDRPTYILTFWNHLKFGFPSTFIVIAVGLLPLVTRKL